MKPIIDKAEVAIDFPDKTYFGTFTRNSGFDVTCDGERVRLRLSQPGTDHRTAEIHLHYYLLADILAAFAQALAEVAPLDEAHHSELQDAVRQLEKALEHDSGQVRTRLSDRRSCSPAIASRKAR